MAEINYWERNRNLFCSSAPTLTLPGPTRAHCKFKKTCLPEPACFDPDFDPSISSATLDLRVLWVGSKRGLNGRRTSKKIEDVLNYVDQRIDTIQIMSTFNTFMVT